MKIDEKYRNGFTKLSSDPDQVGVDVLDVKESIFYEKYPLLKKESIMIIDIIQQKILFAKGFKGLLGYDDDQITIDFILKNRHPNDMDLIDKIGKAAMSYAYAHPFDSHSFMLLITFRRKKKDGKYLKVLSHTSVCEMGERGKIKSLIVKYTDISFLKESDVVRWNFEIDNLDKESFRQSVYKVYADFFTKREKEIIQEIANGNTTGSVAKKMNISKHTVATHRKNILKKAHLHNTKDLILFCKRKGII